MSKKRKADNKDTNAITRSNECFDWPKDKAVFLGDCDPGPGADALTPEQVRSTLCEVMPELADAPMVLWHSASSHIYHKETGEALKGAGGIRVYIIVADGRDIPRFGQILFDRLWMNGHGFYVCSKLGALLPRSLLNASVWQPERLDFAAGAYIAEHEQIEQKRPAPQIFNPDAEPFNTSSISDLSNEEKEQLVGINNAEREAIKPAQHAAREEWIKERLEGLTDEKEREQKRLILEKAILDRKLFADYVLTAKNGSQVTVGEIMDDPDKWHNQYLKDPLEPDYNDGANTGWLNLKSGGKPYLYSHAHGGASYTLYRQTTTLKVAGGELPRVLNETSNIIALSGETFQRAGLLVRIADDGILAVTQPWLKNHIEENVSFLRLDGRKKTYFPSDSPPELATRYIHNRGAWREPERVGLLNGPLFRLDDTLIDSPGYDVKTGLLLKSRNIEGFYKVTRNPTILELCEAFQTLWEPFEHFPFVGPDDAAGALAAMLTTIQRPILPTAPAFGFNAHVAGSGKSYLAKAISWLSGNEPSEMPRSSEPEEQRKRFTAALLAGRSSVLIDNLNGMLDSDILCSILTSESYEDRKLGVSENLNLSTRSLFLVTGNNLTVVKDLCRRVIVSTIDHGTEKPSKLAFPFNPVARVRENWLKYRAAGLTILSAYIAAGSPRITSDSVGSFEVWDNTIRQCVLWLSRQDLRLYSMVPDLGDPINLLDQSYHNDPELARLEEYLSSWHRTYSNQEKTVAKVMQDAGIDLDDTSSIPNDLLIDISGGNKPNSRAIAAFMRQNEGRYVNGYVIRKGRVKSERQLWSVLKA